MCDALVQYLQDNPDRLRAHVGDVVVFGMGLLVVVTLVVSLMSMFVRETLWPAWLAFEKHYDLWDREDR